jgi:hypothetical protein
VLGLRAHRCFIPIDIINERVVDVHLDPVERDDGLHCPAGAAFFQLKNTQRFQVLQIRMNVGHITVDEACGLPHTFGCVFGDRLNEFETERGEAVDEIVVGSELECRRPVLVVERVRLGGLDELVERYDGQGPTDKDVVAQ